MAKLKHQKLRTAIIAACRRMNALGINQGSSGNISARIDDGLLITPSAIAYDAMRPEQIVAMDLDGGYQGERLPSSEWRFHCDIMRTHAEAGAIVHTHARFCTTLSCLHLAIPAFHYMVAVAGGPDIRCAKYATFGTQALSENALAALDGRSACLLANHGMIALGADLDKALALAVEVEALAEQYCRALQLGKPKLLAKAEMARVLARFATYGKQPAEIGPEQQRAVEPPPRKRRPVRRRSGDR